MTLVIGSVLEEIKEAGRDPAPVWVTPFGYAVQTPHGWVVLATNDRRSIEDHPDVEVES